MSRKKIVLPLSIGDTLKERGDSEAAVVAYGLALVIGEGVRRGVADDHKSSVAKYMLDDIQEHTPSPGAFEVPITVTYRTTAGFDPHAIKEIVEDYLQRLADDLVVSFPEMEERDYRHWMTVSWDALIHELDTRGLWPGWTDRLDGKRGEEFQLYGDELEEFTPEDFGEMLGLPIEAPSWDDTKERMEKNKNDKP